MTKLISCTAAPQTYKFTSEGVQLWPASAITVSVRAAAYCAVLQDLPCRLAFPRTPALLPTEGALLNNRYPLANLRCISTAAATFPNRHTPSPPLCRVGRGCAPGAWPKLLPGRRRRSGLPAVLVPGFATERSVEIRGRMHRIPTRDDDHHRLQPIHVRLVMEVAPIVGIPTTRERQAHEGLALAAFRPVQAFPVTIKAACRFSNSVSSCDTPTCC